MRHRVGVGLVLVVNQASREFDSGSYGVKNAVMSHMYFVTLSSRREFFLVSVCILRKRNVIRRVS
jgi:hypothetical protein